MNQEKKDQVIKDLLSKIEQAKPDKDFHRFIDDLVRETHMGMAEDEVFEKSIDEDVDSDSAMEIHERHNDDTHKIIHGPFENKIKFLINYYVDDEESLKRLMDDFEKQLI